MIITEVNTIFSTWYPNLQPGQRKADKLQLAVTHQPKGVDQKHEFST